MSKCEHGHDYTVQQDGTMKCKDCPKTVKYNVMTRKWEEK